MKKQYTLFASNLLGILLAISMMNTITMVSATHVPGTVTETGDSFVFTETRTKTQNNSRYFEMVNQTDPNQLFHGDDEYDYEFVNFLGSADVGIIRQTPNIPNLGENDTLVYVRSEGQTQPGSYRQGYQNSTESQNGQPLAWTNPTPYYEDLSGRHDSNENSQAMMSNATYAVIFPELGLTELNIYQNNDGGNNNNPFFNIGGFTGIIPRTNFVVVTETKDFTINNAVYNLNIVTITITFSGLWEDSMNQTVWFGPENDIHTPTSDVLINRSLSFSYTASYSYDSATTMLVKTTSASGVTINYDFPVQNRTLTPQEGQSLNVTLFQNGTFSSVESSVSLIESASDMYGNTAPTSVAGDSRINDGEYLLYDLEQGHSFNMVVDFKMQDKDNGGVYQNGFNINSYDESSGDLYIDVFRHSNNAFEAVIYLDGLANYHYSKSEYDTDQNGNIVNLPTETHDENNRPVIFFGLIQFGWDATSDILPFFEDKMWIETDFLDNCNDGDDCVNLNFNRELTKDGVVNDTSYYINLVEMGDGEYPVINGYTQYEFNVNEQTQNYALAYSGLTPVPIGDGPERQWIDVTIDVTGDGRQSFYFDEDTGAMVAMNQEMDAVAEIHHTQDFSFINEMGQQINTTIQIDLTMTWNMWWSMLLSEHPDSYNSQPTMPVVSSSTSSTPPSSSKGESSADLPLPVPFLPSLFGIFAIGVMIRRRK